jgi:hypothetical protein
MALGRFKILKELALIRALEPEPEIVVPPEAPLCFLPEDANEDEGGINFGATEHSDWDSNSDLDSDSEMERYFFEEDMKVANDPKVITTLWDRTMRMDGGLKAFKDVKLTFRLAKRDYTPPLLQRLECYYQGL